MKISRIHFVTLLVALTIPAFAADEHKHTGGEKHADHSAKIDVTIPETTDALWAEIGTRSKALADLVGTKKADGIHEAAEIVEALVNAVPVKNADIAPDKKKRVEGMAKNIAKALDKVHEEAEEGHWDAAAKTVKQVEAAIKIIGGQIGK